MTTVSYIMSNASPIIVIYSKCIVVTQVCCMCVFALYSYSIFIFSLVYKAILKSLLLL